MVSPQLMDDTYGYNMSSFAPIVVSFFPFFFFLFSSPRFQSQPLHIFKATFQFIILSDLVYVPFILDYP